MRWKWLGVSLVVLAIIGVSLWKVWASFREDSPLASGKGSHPPTKESSDLGGEQAPENPAEVINVSTTQSATPEVDVASLALEVSDHVASDPVAAERVFKGMVERALRKRSALPAAQQTEAGRNAILAQSVADTVKDLASDTQVPWGARRDAPFDPLEITFSDLRVQKLVAAGIASEEGRREVVDEISRAIAEYARRPGAIPELGSDSFTEGWRTGYDGLAAVLAFVDQEADIFPLMLAAFARHQAEIGNPLGKNTPEYDRWIPVGCGHNSHFYVYCDQAIPAYAQRLDVPAEVRQIAEAYAEQRQRDSKKVFQCADQEITMAWAFGLANTPNTLLKLAEAMRKTGLYEAPGQEE